MPARLGLVLALAGCAAAPEPPPGSEVRAEMVRLIDEQELARDSGLRARLLPSAARRDAAGVELYAAEGRLAVTRCALAAHEMLFPLAVLPRGIVPEQGDLMRVRLGDETVPDEALGIVTEPVELERGSVPTAAMEAGAEGQYFRVEGGWLVRCLAP